MANDGGRRSDDLGGDLRIEPATLEDLSEIIASAEALVATDAARHDTTATDVTWAARSGLAYATALVTSPDNLVLLAREGDVVVGHRVARLHSPGSVHPIRVAEVESIHVYPRHRGRGVGHRLMQRFMAWAAAQRADRASVTAYVANEGARRFYARYGFVATSVILHCDSLPAAEAQ